MDPPELPPDVTSPADIASYCENEDGEFDNTEEWCSWYYDTVKGQFYEIGSDYASAGGYAPNYALMNTNKQGVVEAYLYLDALPQAASEGEGAEVAFGEAQIFASIGHASDTLTIRSSNQ